MTQVQISDGILEGEVLDNVVGGKYYSFKGIPYAAPPLGDLRFKAPQPVKPWNGVRSAQAHGSRCHQFNMFSHTVHEGSEDCLYLNVYTPTLNPKKPLPVMFWIHGGGFSSGSGNSNIFGPDFLVNRDVVLVTINYRLEIVGFLCLHTKDVPGNAGMKDQVAALRWVQKNIKHFGGDANNVTIFGESAGGASVAYHLVSPMTKGLFKRAILQSGQNLSHWSRAFEPRLRAEAIARSLGLDSTDDKDLYEFFKSQPIENLIGINVPLTVEEDAGIRINVTITVADEKQFDNEERYFYGDIYESLEKGIHEGVDIMIGYTTHEGTIQFNTLPKEGTFDKYNKFLQCFVPIELLLKCSAKDQLAIGNKVRQYYFGNKTVGPDTVDTLVKYITMQMVLYDIYQYAKNCIRSNNANRLFFYQFDMYSERNICAKMFKARRFVKGKNVCHCDDLMYLFDHKDVPVNLNSESYRMIRTVTKLWTDFAKFGDPTPDGSLGVEWPTYNLEDQKYLIIGDKLAVSTFRNNEEFDFWEQLHENYLSVYLGRASRNYMPSNGCELLW